ncbi:pre-mRNA-splicing ATP-dependent RNA helicase Prp28p [[Candida] jaroonii]|uniref:Pre-mRNA-splicing ATP-dependent RNA helicase Prp28p n=1 Tax=[Candida] jaroonii TaxID=467808 RepID=A0ACA9YAA7_9ASCO|nr:pre-mRNA-splicing ATP-dependent RNA helicase Prp28p [[Candida] jaroonii]
MRPVSIDELLAVNKPKFIRKDKRIRQEAKVVKKKKVVVEKDNFTTKPVVNPSKKDKFSFDWDEQDDTSQGFVPLVVDEGAYDDIGGRSDWRDKNLQTMTSSDWRSFREEFNIKTKNCDINPMRSWKESSLAPEIVKLLLELEFYDPTPIQRCSVPIAEHKDIIGIAETGSGKTLAYLIPLMNHILKLPPVHLQNPTDKPLGLVLAPTRELANQIKNEVDNFTSLGINSVSIIGGHQYQETIDALNSGVHIVVATPGRLIDILEKKLLNLSDCNFLIFDEADRMIDMGFEKDLEKLYTYLPTTRRSLMFTATFSKSINDMTSKYLQDPAQLVIGKIGEKVDNITQQFEYGDELTEDKKLGRLLTVLKNRPTIIFANYIKTVEYLSQHLSEKGYKNVTLHGSKSQMARERAIDEFSNNKVNILVATDVAARGIDIDISCVVNYQMPKKIDEYIHRIGRTGRAGNYGYSFSFVDGNDEHLFVDLKKFLKKNIPSWLERKTSQQTIRD